MSEWPYRRVRSEPGPIPTLGQLEAVSGKWVWAICRSWPRLSLEAAVDGDSEREAADLSGWPSRMTHTRNRSLVHASTKRVKAGVDSFHSREFQMTVLKLVILYYEVSFLLLFAIFHPSSDSPIFSISDRG